MGMNGFGGNGRDRMNVMLTEQYTLCQRKSKRGRMREKKRHLMNAAVVLCGR